MEDALERIDRLPKVLILRLHLVSAMDATALNALESVIERLQHHGGTVILSGLHRQPLGGDHPACGKGALQPVRRDTLAGAHQRRRAQGGGIELVAILTPSAFFIGRVPAACEAAIASFENLDPA